MPSQVLQLNKDFSGAERPPPLVRAAAAASFNAMNHYLVKKLNLLTVYSNEIMNWDESCQFCESFINIQK